MTLRREANSPPEPPAPSGRRPGDCCTLRARAVGRIHFLGGFGLCYVASVGGVGTRSSGLLGVQIPPDATVSSDYSGKQSDSRAEGRSGTETRRLAPKGEWGEGVGRVVVCRARGVGGWGREAVDARPVGGVNGTNLKVRQTDARRNGGSSARRPANSSVVPAPPDSVRHGPAERRPASVRLPRSLLSRAVGPTRDVCTEPASR